MNGSTTWRAGVAGTAPTEAREWAFYPLCRIAARHARVQPASTRQSELAPRSHSDCLDERMNVQVLAGQYELAEKLHTSTSSSIWRAWAHRRDTPVAVKVLHSIGSQQSEAVVRFGVTANALCTMEDGYTVRYLDYGVHEGTCFLAMELLTGETLREQIRQRGGLRDRGTFEVVWAVGKSLSEAHAHGVHHGRLTASDVVITPREALSGIDLRVVGHGVAGGGDCTDYTASRKADIRLLALLALECLTAEVQLTSAKQDVKPKNPDLHTMSVDLPGETSESSYVWRSWISSAVSSGFGGDLSKAIVELHGGLVECRHLKSLEKHSAAFLLCSKEIEKPQEVWWVVAQRPLRLLRFFTPAEPFRHVPCPRPPFNIGYEGDASAPDPALSKQHARIRPEEGAALSVADLASTNGTFVNGERVYGAARLLKPGDVVCCGNSLWLATKGAPSEVSASPTAEVVGGASLGELCAEVARIAKSRSRLFLGGETGCGKSTLARAMCGTGPFVVVNCATLRGDVGLAEILGLRDRAATSVNATAGVFEQAHGGTLFLDEIADLDPPMQAALLGALGEDTGAVVARRGRAQAPVAYDVFVVSASNRDMDTLVREGKFRADLWERLRTHELRVPPLRERAEDLPLLAARFACLHDLRFDWWKSARWLSDACQQPWRGNVREYFRALHRIRQAVCGSESASSSPVVRLDEHRAQWNQAQQLDVRGQECGAHAPVLRAGREDCWDKSRRSAWKVAKASRDDQALAELALEVCAHCGTQKAAARLLGIDEKTLRRYLKMLDH